MPASIPSIQMAVENDSHAVSDPKGDTDEIKVDLVQFPEGGTTAWCTVVGAALVQLCGFGYTTSFGVYQDFYTLHYITNETTSAISWIGSSNAFLVAAFSIVAGMLYDRGYFYYLLFGGSLLQSFCLFMLSLAQPDQYYQIFLSQGIGLGIAQGLMYVPTLAVVSHHFCRRRTLAMSLVASGSSLGSIIHPIMLNNLLNRGMGFASGVRISAAFVTLLLLISCFLIRTRLAPPEHPANYLTVGRGIVRDVPFCIMSIGLLFFQTAFYYPLFYFQLDSVKHGNSGTFSFYSLVLLNGGGLIGRLSAGFIAPHIGVPRFMIVSTAACGILILGMIGLDGPSTVVILGTIYGYFGGTYVALLSPLMAILTSSHSELGARMGIGMTIGSIGNLLAGPVSGALLTPQYKWWQSSLFSGLMALTGSSLLLLMQITLTHRRIYSNEKQVP